MGKWRPTHLLDVPHARRVVDVALQQLDDLLPRVGEHVERAAAEGPVLGVRPLRDLAEDAAWFC